MSVGIDRIGLHTSYFYLDSIKFANLFGIKENVFKRTIDQIKNSVIAKNEDVVSLALNAVEKIILPNEKFDMFIFATETSFDNSKAASLYLSEYLNINKNCICFEIKQACYASTAALICGINYIKSNENAKVLIVASDVAEYMPNTNGQFTNGNGAVAFILSSNPKLIEIEDNFSSIHQNAYDFFKPHEEKYAIVFGQDSIQLYLNFFNILHLNFQKDSILIPHMPFSLMFDKICNFKEEFKKYLKYKEEIKCYTKEIGNCYSASIFLALCSLFDNCKEDLSNKNLLFFAYGSGAMATLFNAKVISGYKLFLNTHYNKALLLRRKKVENFDNKNLFNDLKGEWVIDKIEDYKRFYKKNG